MGCEYMVKDGCGHYCKLCKIPEDIKKDYPHKYWRVFCYGMKDSLSCIHTLKSNKLRNKKRI